MRTIRASVTSFAVATSLIVLAGAAAATMADPVGTPAQVTAAIKSSISLKVTPSAVQKTLKEYSSPSSYDLTGPSTFGVCDPYNSEALALAPKACFAGNVHGAKTIVIVGDSNVGNWVPALNLGLAATPYRLAIFGYSSCGLPNLKYTSTWNTQYKRCNQWHAHLPAAIRALHPVAILASSGAVGSSISTSTWVNGVKSLFVQSTQGSPSTKRVILGTTPFFVESAVTCLTVHNDPQDCSLTYQPGSGYYGSILARDKKVASGSDAVLIKSTKFFCYSDTCSPVIGNELVYSDIDHVTIAYSSFISKEVTAAVLAAIK
jgi:SGNH domain-containing protein